MTAVKSLPKRVLTFAGVGLLLLAIVVAVLPTLVGSRWIYEPFLKRLAANDFRVSVGEIYLRWLSPVRFGDIAIRQESGQQLITIEQIKTDRSLIGHLLGGRQLGRIEIHQPNISVELLKDGSNLQRFVQAIDAGAKDKQRAPKQPPAFDVDLVMRGVRATVSKVASDFVSASENRATVDLNTQAATANADAASRASANAVASESNLGPLVVVPPFDMTVHYTALSGASRLKVDPTPLLREVQITRELIELGLGHAVPLLAKSAWFDGKVSLDVGIIDVPLDDPKQANAKLSLTLHQVRSGPSDPVIMRALDLLARLRKSEVPRELVFVDGSTIDIEVRDGRVFHRGLQFGLPQMDSRLQIATSGSVGLEDRTLDMLLEIPIPVEQLARREQVQQLGVPMLRLPIRGTLDNPIIDWNAMRNDTTALLSGIKQALGDDAPNTAKVVGLLEGLSSGQADDGIEAAFDLLQQFRENRKANREQAESENGGAPPERRPVRDALRDLLRPKRSGDQPPNP